VRPSQKTAPSEFPDCQQTAPLRKPARHRRRAEPENLFGTPRQRFRPFANLAQKQVEKLSRA
jgi:hypothetical protein